MAIASKKVALNADGTAATVAAATVGDMFTTLFSTTEAVTGWYGVGQKALLVAGGAVIQKYMDTGAFGIPFMKAS